jgi:hypothetical protein
MRVVILTAAAALVVLAPASSEADWNTEGLHRGICGRRNTADPVLYRFTAARLICSPGLDVRF